VNRWLLLAFATAALGCGESLSNGRAAAPAAGASAPQPAQSLRVHVADDVAIVAEGDTGPGLAENLKAAVEAELGRQGLRIVRANDKSVDLTVRIETRIRGAVYLLHGHVGLTVERAGVSVATAATDDEIHRESEFPVVMADKAVALLLGTPALREFAQRHRSEPARDKTAPRPAPRPTPTLAKAPSPEAMARAHFGRATSYYNLGRYQEALAEYEAAYLAVQDPPFLFDIAQCHRMMGRDKEALGAYRSYLRVAPDAPNRSEVEKRIAELERGTRYAR